MRVQLIFVDSRLKLKKKNSISQKDKKQQLKK